jgi:hypothetical protein
MPKIKGLYVNLPRLLMADTVDKLMLGYVIGFRVHSKPFPVMQVRRAIEQFMIDFGLSEDDYPLESAQVTFYRLLKQYRKFDYNDSNTKRN